MEGAAKLMLIAPTEKAHSVLLLAPPLLPLPSLPTLQNLAACTGDHKRLQVAQQLKLLLGMQKFKAGKEAYGLTSTVGEYNLWCMSDYPAMILSYFDTTKYQGYDVKTGVVTNL
jgi:hypothetical protein